MPIGTAYRLVQELNHLLVDSALMAVGSARCRCLLLILTAESPSVQLYVLWVYDGVAEQ